MYWPGNHEDYQRNPAFLAWANKHCENETLNKAHSRVSDILAKYFTAKDLKPVMAEFLYKLARKLYNRLYSLYTLIFTTLYKL